MLFIILSWIFLYIIIQGYGFIAKRLLSSTFSKSFFEQFWFGLALFLGIIQLTSLIFPLGIHVFFIFSIIGFIFYILDIINNFWNYLPNKLTPSIVLLLFILLSVIISYYSLQNVTWYDTYLYHFNIVRWIHDYPVIPGLANLHDRLGFNSILFSFAAYIDNFFMSGNSVRISLSFLIVATIANVLKILFSMRTNIQQKILAVTAIAYILAIIIFRGIINSFSTDFSSLIFIILFALNFLADTHNHKLLILLSILSVMFKLSAFPIFVFLPFLILKNKNYRSYLFSFILVIGYILRNIIQTGWPLYPMPFFRIPFDWSVSTESVLFAVNAIKAYSRTPGIHYLDSLNMTFFSWFSIWFRWFSETLEFKLLILAIIINFISILPVIPKRFKNIKIIVLTLFSLLGLTYVFVTAPNVRFASIYIYLFLACSLIPIASYLLDIINKHLVFNKDNLVSSFYIIYSIILLLVFSLIYFKVNNNQNYMMHYLYIKPYYYEKRPVIKKILPNGGDFIYTPVSGNQCGYSILPCTPYFNKNLKYRKSGEIQEGFIIKKE